MVALGVRVSPLYTNAERDPCALYTTLNADHCGPLNGLMLLMVRIVSWVPPLYFHSSMLYCGRGSCGALDAERGLSLSN